VEEKKELTSGRSLGNERKPTSRIPKHARNEYNVCRCNREAVMAGEKILTLRLEGGLRGKLDKLAAATRRSRSFLAAEAIREYVALNSWQIEEIHKGLAEADRGEFASESDVKRVAKKWNRRAR
jgi:RHH-type rel operon transcriptional repressor/antitoxin RelB